jgi:hypothetical protein
MKFPTEWENKIPVPNHQPNHMQKKGPPKKIWGFIDL